MNKKDIIAFFDRCAPTWDGENSIHPEIIDTILDHAEVAADMDVLDVGCGTGVLFPFYLQRGVSSVTGIDISPKMAAIAREKFRDQPRVQVICGDVEQTAFTRKFDRVVVYNALPHFPQPRLLIKTLAGLLKEGGRLTVAHSASREAIERLCHEKAAGISYGLMTADSLKRLFDPYFDVEILISNSRMYQLSGVKRDALTHSHGTLTHSHSHGHRHHDHAPQADCTPLQELLVMMNYLVSHNDAHAQEVAELARALLSAGKCAAYDQIMDAVSDFDMVNAKLAGILNQLSDFDL